MTGLPDPGPSRGITGALHGRRVIARVHPGEERAIKPRRKKINLFKAKALQGLEELPLGIASFLQLRLESHF